jgi:hypothetical protein
MTGAGKQAGVPRRWRKVDHQLKTPHIPQSSMASDPRWRMFFLHLRKPDRRARVNNG